MSMELPRTPALVRLLTNAGSLIVLMLASPDSAGRRSPRKAEKKPVYVLNLTIPPRFVDNTVDPSKAAVQLQVLLLTTVHGPSLC